jgi:hypothetical protein
MYSPKDYWSNLAEGFESMDRSGFAPVLHPQAPSWLNEAIDALQFRACLDEIVQRQRLNHDSISTIQISDLLFWDRLVRAKGLQNACGRRSGGA